MQRNAEILPPHAAHPGWDAEDCFLRIIVTPRWGAPVAPGFACGWTGGHCLPCDRCPERRRQAAQEADAETFS